MAIEAQERREEQRGVRGLLRTSEHVAGIYATITALHQAMRQQDAHVLWWEIGPCAQCRYQDQEGWQTFAPDAHLALQRGERVLRAWIEWDAGTMLEHILHARLQMYACYVRSRHWYREGPTLPLLLFIVPGTSQEERVWQMARALLSETALRVWTTTAARLAAQGGAFAIWFPAIPSSGGTERQSVFVP